MAPKLSDTESIGLQKRRSISYAPKELGSPRGSFDVHGAPGGHAPTQKSTPKLGAVPGELAGMMGTHTRHGVVPGPSGSAYAKINQDRGVVYWPFNDSTNEAVREPPAAHRPRPTRPHPHAHSHLPCSTLQRNL